MFVKSHGMGNASDVYHPGYYFCGGKPQPYIQGLNGVRGLYWIRSLIYRAKESGVPVWTTPKSSRMKEKTEIVLPNSRRFDTVVQVRVDQEIIETMSALMYLGRVYEGSSVFTEAQEHTMRNYGRQSVEKRKHGELNLTQFLTCHGNFRACLFKS
ncbi:hypothetical protein J6590_105194, partial [Homalodisca vitripennis]